MPEHDFKESLAPRCPQGYILRDSYTTKNGTYVPARCIVKRGIYPGKAEVVDRRIIRDVARREKRALKDIKEMCEEEGCKIPTSCPKGQILRAAYKREAYTRSDGTRVHSTLVAPSCIEDRGAPGKGRKEWILRDFDHVLSQHGYEDVKNKSEIARHRALNKVLKALADKHGERQSYITAIKELVARANYQIRTNPHVSKIFKDDADWISEKYAEFKKKEGITN